MDKEKGEIDDQVEEELIVFKPRQALKTTPTTATSTSSSNSSKANYANAALTPKSFASHSPLGRTTANANQRLVFPLFNEPFLVGK